MEFVPPFAPLVVLAFLGTASLFALAAAALVYGLWAGRPRLVAAVAGAALTLGLLYGGALLAASLVSRERVLSPGEKKYFCEIDCHLAYSVEKVETAKDLGVPPHAVRAGGLFHVVTLRTWFDESTISSRRARGMPLTPNPRIVFVRDAASRRYDPAPVRPALESTGRRSTPLTRPLRPGESYVTHLVFDLPEGVRDPRLFVGNEPGVELVLIGHEMSPLHKKVWFSLI